MDPAKFRAYLEAEIGKREADLATVSPAKPEGAPEGNQNASKNNSPTVGELSGESMSHGKRENLRAILRAPEIVQDLYKAGLMTQTDAAKMGPKSPTPEKAAQIAEARQELEKLAQQTRRRRRHHSPAPGRHSRAGVVRAGYRRGARRSDWQQKRGQARNSGGDF